MNIRLSSNRCRRRPLGWRAAGPFLLLGVCSLVGAGCQIEDQPAGPEIVANHSQNRPFAGEAELRVSVRFPIGQIIVEAAPENLLFSLDADYYSGRFEPEASYDDATRHLDFRLRAVGEVDFDGRHWRLPIGTSLKSLELKNRLILKVSPRVRLDLDLQAGVGETRINLSGLSTRTLDLEAGVSSTLLSCGTPNPIVCDRLNLKAGVGEFEADQLGNLNFRRLEFQGGIGSSSLDFSGSWRQSATIGVDLGIGELRVKLPREVGAEIESPKRFLSGLHLESFSRRGSYYYSENFESATTRLNFRIRTGIGSVTVKWL